MCHAAVLDGIPPATSTSIASHPQKTTEPPISIVDATSTVTVSVPNGCKLFSDCQSGENAGKLQHLPNCSLCLHIPFMGILMDMKDMEHPLYIREPFNPFHTTAFHPSACVIMILHIPHIWGVRHYNLTKNALWDVLCDFVTSFGHQI